MEIKVQILERAEGRQDGIALKTLMLRAGLPDLDHGMKTMQAAGGHFDVLHDGYRCTQGLEQTGLQHILAQHDGLAADAIDGVIDGLIAMT